MIKLRVLSLFAGIGGFDLGLERTGGFETVSLCELKPHARAVLAKNFPGVPCHDDVTTYDFKEGEADVIAAGFPCQDISYAGLGAGLAGARSGLYREVIRALRVVRPLYAVLENVAALLSRGLDTVLGDLASIGYDAEWHCIPASAVGAPHRRDRVWIVAHARGEQHQGCRPPLSGALSEELSRAYARNTGAPSWNDAQADAQHSYADSLGSYRAQIDINRGVELRDEQVGELGPLGGHVADTPGERCGEARELRHLKPAQRSSGGSEEMANADIIDVQGFVASLSNEEGRPGSIQRPAGSRGDGLGWWAVEPDVGRVAHGVPQRVDRLAELGNAVVPQIPEIIGRAILSAETNAASNSRSAA